MTFESEVRRSMAEILYWRDYRYRDGTPGTMLEYVNDVVADEAASEGPFSKDDANADEWLRRYSVGSWKRSTGEYYFTTPQPQRLASLDRLVEERGLILPVAIMPHEASETMARLIAEARHVA